jgi:hypothetical protein
MRLNPAMFIVVLVTTYDLFGDSLGSLPSDPQQVLERTCFQTGQPWSGLGNLRSDVAIVYGIDAGLPSRIRTWRDHGYRIHVMTGVAWGQYQDYLSGRFDGINHEDEAQTDRNGTLHQHGDSRDIFYMCPGTNYGKFLCVGVQRALDAGAEAIHLEEPEFWVQDGYEGGFKREWRSSYGEDWQPPHRSVDAQWRASKLKYFLYRRALQQVFDYIQAYNRETGRNVRCYVPTHSLLNYAHWRIVSPESSLARLNGCDGYIAQVWTGTARTPNMYRGVLRERTFETAFLEYGAMQNLVRSTGRRVWYLNDPLEDNQDHDWHDYRSNWESTLVASLLQPEVWRYEVAPWPERVFGGRYPLRAAERHGIPPAYATELQVVMNALNGMSQNRVTWDCGTTGIGMLVSDSLMFERGDPSPSDSHLSQVYGLALPLLKHGIPVTPVQLENVNVPDYLRGYRILLLTYNGMKPLTQEVDAQLAKWVKHGGMLVICDDDADPYNAVREWWNSNGLHCRTPREHLFQQLGLTTSPENTATRQFVVGKGGVIWLRHDPASLAYQPKGETLIMELVRQACSHCGLAWRETNYLLLRRGPYVIAAGLDESIASDAAHFNGRFINLFDSELQVRQAVDLTPGSRFFLLDLTKIDHGPPRALASASKMELVKQTKHSMLLLAEGVADTEATVLFRLPTQPQAVRLASQSLSSWTYSTGEQLLWVRFPNRAAPQELAIEF